MAFIRAKGRKDHLDPGSGEGSRGTGDGRSMGIHACRSLDTKDLKKRLESSICHHGHQPAPTVLHRKHPLGNPGTSGRGVSTWTHGDRGHLVPDRYWPGLDLEPGPVAPVRCRTSDRGAQAGRAYRLLSTWPKTPDGRAWRRVSARILSWRASWVSLS